MLDFEIQRCSRQCAATGRSFEPGEEFVSLLIRDGADIVRKDYSLEAWEGPPESAIGWWKSQMPSHDSNQATFAPNQVLINYFEQLSNQPEQAELCYILSLFLLRRKLLSVVPSQPDSTNSVRYYCNLTEQEYEVLVAVPDAARVEELEQALEQLLFAGADGSDQIVSPNGH